MSYYNPFEESTEDLGTISEDRVWITLNPDSATELGDDHTLRNLARRERWQGILIVAMIYFAVILGIIGVAS